MEQDGTPVHAVAMAAGAVGCGVASVEPFADALTTMQERRSSGMSGSLGFTFRDPATATDILKTFPWARRLVVVATTYLPEAGSPSGPAPGTGRVARFATHHHYERLAEVLGAIALNLRTSGHRAEAIHDDNRLVDRAAAVRAGVGWWGKNTMVLTPGHGPWILLGSVVTDADLPLDTAMSRSCGTCSACLPACPTGALVEPGVLDVRLCLAYLLQTPGAIPRELREAVGDRIYGCDDCLDVCPPGNRSLSLATADRGRVDLLAVLAASDRELESATEHWYVPKRRMDYVRRNALVALGNSGDDRHVYVVAGWLGNGSSTLRSHAAWALGQIGGDQARRALDAAATVESDSGVLAEIQHAVVRCAGRPAVR
ncbi:epoxyqueuosine reductase [bacterium BMS3Bbin02]|nr:epoxyqueuosine reductase [bacterium BMS3Bbin02]